MKLPALRTYAHAASIAALTIAALMVCSCSDPEPPSLEELVDDATAEVKPGDELSFVRLANDAVIHDATVHKVDGQMVLISESGKKDASPYWINLGAAVSYRQQSLVLTSGAAKEVEESSTIEIVRIDSIEEAVKAISRFETGTPSGKKWEDLGILERRDWMGRLSAEIPDFAIPSSVVVKDVIDLYGIVTIYGHYDMPPNTSESLIDLKKLPSKASFSFRSYQDDGFQFPSGERVLIKTLKPGDTYKFHFILRASFSYRNDKVSVDLRIHDLLRM